MRSPVRRLADLSAQLDDTNLDVKLSMTKKFGAYVPCVVRRVVRRVVSSLPSLVRDLSDGMRLILLLFFSLTGLTTLIRSEISQETPD